MKYLWYQIIHSAKYGEHRIEIVESLGVFLKKLSKPTSSNFKKPVIP
jgi:hypothetical protein